jgi:protein tyrosine kinase modulator
MEVATGSGAGRLRHWRLILIPTLLAALAGFLVSYAFPAKYTSQSLVLMEGQTVPESIVQPAVTEDLTVRIAIMQQKILSQTQLQAMLERLSLVKRGQSADDIIESIRSNMEIEPVVTDVSQRINKGNPNQSPVPGFYVSYTAANPREAQQLCNELTSLLLNENLRSRQDSVMGTTHFLDKELNDARRSLEAMDAEFFQRTKGLKFRSPEGEEEYQVLALEHEIEKKSYTDLLSKLSQAQAAEKLEIDLEDLQLGEQMHLLNPASLPNSPIFPDRYLFAGGGLGAGLVFGIGLALRLRYRRGATS